MLRRCRFAAAAAALVWMGCATDCPECRCLTLDLEKGAGGTLPYVLEIDDSVACDVVSRHGEAERLRCYAVELPPGTP